MTLVLYIYPHIEASCISHGQVKIPAMLHISLKACIVEAHMLIYNNVAMT